MGKPRGQTLVSNSESLRRKWASGAMADLGQGKKVKTSLEHILPEKATRKW